MCVSHSHPISRVSLTNCQLLAKVASLQIEWHESTLASTTTLTFPFFWGKWPSHASVSRFSNVFPHRQHACAQTRKEHQPFDDFFKKNRKSRIPFCCLRHRYSKFRIINKKKKEERTFFRSRQSNGDARALLSNAWTPQPPPFRHSWP